MFMSFIFGTEISVFPKICKWWWRGGGGKLRRRCCVSSFSNCYFSDKIDQNGVRHSFNFHFSLLISKKRSKNGVKTLVWMIALCFTATSFSLCISLLGGLILLMNEETNQLVPGVKVWLFQNYDGSDLRGDDPDPPGVSVIAFSFACRLCL